MRCVALLDAYCKSPMVLLAVKGPTSRWADAARREQVASLDLVWHTGTGRVTSVTPCTILSYAVPCVA